MRPAAASCVRLVTPKNPFTAASRLCLAVRRAGRPVRRTRRRAGTCRGKKGIAFRSTAGRSEGNGLESRRCSRPSRSYRTSGPRAGVARRSSGSGSPGSALPLCRRRCAAVGRPEAVGPVRAATTCLRSGLSSTGPLRDPWQDRQEKQRCGAASTVQTGYMGGHRDLADLVAMHGTHRSRALHLCPCRGSEAAESVPRAFPRLAIRGPTPAGPAQRAKLRARTARSCPATAR